MACSSTSSDDSLSYDFSGSDSDLKPPGTSSRPRRLPISNSKNAVAARMNRMKQKEYVKNLEQKMSRLKREMKDVKKELRERDKKWASSLRQVSYLRGMIANSQQIGSVLRNIRWSNIVPQGSNVDKTLNELNSETSVDRFPITTSPSLFDGCFDLLEERENNPLEPPPISPDDDEDWTLFNDINSSTTELRQDTVLSNHVAVLP